VDNFFEIKKKLKN